MNSRMDVNIKIILMLLLAFTETRADLAKLMDRLYSKSWPFFGEKYPTTCPNPEENWPKCYNPRPDIKIDVLNRIGIKEANPAFELEVIFSAPAEMADVCGKNTQLSAVGPFKLNSNGFSIQDLLKRGAEIYRRMPIVKWKETLIEEHSLLFIDSGFVKIRGYIGNVKNNGTHLLGEILWPYTPPANPVPDQNPIVIVLIKESLATAISNYGLLLSRQCMTRGISKAKLRYCMGVFADIIGGAKVAALQVFYTDSSSLYEKSRVCMEGAFCVEECFNLYKAYAQGISSSVEFMTVPASDLNMYVNLDVMSVRRFNYTACCNYVVVEPYTFRAVPGDNNMVDDTAKLHKPYRVEFSGSGDIALDEAPYYSVLMVDPDAVYPEAKKLPYGHLWIANLKYQDHYTTGLEIVKYAAPTPPNYAEHTYYIVLFSHMKPIEVMPSGFYRETSPGCDSRCMWDLSKIPRDFNIRGITWFKATTDNFTRQFLARPGQSCLPRPQDVGDPSAQLNCRIAETSYNEVPQMAIDLQYVGTLSDFEDAENVDVEGAGAGKGFVGTGNSLRSSETLWLIVFCVGVLLHFHIIFALFS